MKKTLICISFILMMLLAVSCNLDNEEGLFQEAGNSTRHENFNSYGIVGSYTIEETETSTKCLVISTDKGIQDIVLSVYDKDNKQTSYKIGVNKVANTDYRLTGSIAKNTLYADNNTVVYYSSETGKEGFYLQDTTTPSDAVKLDNLDKWILSGSAFSPNGTNFNYVFRDKATGKYAVFSGVLTDPTSFNTLTPVPVEAPESGYYISGISIIGNNEFIATVLKEGTKPNTSGNTYLFTADAPALTKKLDSFYWGYCSGVAIDHKGVIHFDDLTGTISTNVTPHNPVAMFDTGDKVLVIPSSSGIVWSCSKKDGKYNSPTISGLSSLYVSSIIGKTPEDYYLLMTAASGIQILDMSTNNEELKKN